MTKRYTPTQFEPFDNLVGGLPRGALTAFVGPPQAGKTTITTQLATALAAQAGQNVLIFDTELSYHSHEALAEGLSKRYGVDINPIRVVPQVRQKGPKDAPKWEVDWDMDGKPEKGKVNLFVVHCPDIRPILVIHGRGADLEISSNSGKVKSVLLAGAFAPSIEQAPFYKFVKDHDIAALVYDSLTNPLDEFPAVGENFPARTDFTQLWLIQIQKLAASLDIPVLATVHESTNPTSPFQPDLKVEGGKGVGYSLKFIVYMMAKKNKGFIPAGSPVKNKVPTLTLSERHLFNMRHPREAPWNRYVTVELTGEGFVAAGAKAGQESQDDDQEVEN